MILLQAAMPGGFLMMVFLGLLLLAGVPILTTILMRVYRKATGKNDRAKKEFYKDIIPFISIVIFSLIALLLLFYLLVILFDSVIPSSE